MSREGAIRESQSRRYATTAHDAGAIPASLGAAASGQSRATITRAIAAGELEATKHRNRWSIDLDDLDRWTAQRPLSAGRGTNGRFQRGEVPEPSQMPLRSPQSAAEGPQASGATHTPA